MKGKLPTTASVAHPDAGGKLHAPAAARNAEVLSALLQSVAPATGRVLELASGTGQHITRFAADMPGLTWYPTEVDEARLRSIDAHIAEAGLKNVVPATFLDATTSGWSAEPPGPDMILLVNLLHLIDTPRTRTLLEEAGRAVPVGGQFVLYGPFRRDGALTSEGDARFDAQLRAADAAIGYKDSRDVFTWLRDAGFGTIETREMPANNLAFIAERTC